jgi:hypothetical protein
MNILFAGVLIIFLYLISIGLILAVPIALAVRLFSSWLRYIRKRTFFSQSYILLELKLPKDIARSPVGMEIFFTALQQTAAATYIETYWGGKIRPLFSFELASVDGNVHFYIYTRKAFRTIIEAQIYAQYPNVEIFEVPDYTRTISHDPSETAMWGTQFLYSKPNAYPIKTYVDYGLDKDPDEEYKIDPMTSVLEYLGSLKPGEQTWIQIIIQAHKKIDRKHGKLIGAEIPDWKDGVKVEIEKIRGKGITPPAGEAPRFPNPTRGESDMIAALERHVGKIAFEVVIRGIYITKKDIFNASLGLTGLIGSFRQYNSANLNGFKLGRFTDFDDTGKDILTLFAWLWPVTEVGRYIRDGMEKHMLNMFKWRYAFLEPYHGFNPEPLIMTTEELATIWHFPGQVATTPTIARSTSKKAEPPPNLPI